MGGRASGQWQVRKRLLFFDALFLMHGKGIARPWLRKGLKPLYRKFKRPPL
jgi:hypothetical protein